MSNATTMLHLNEGDVIDGRADESHHKLRPDPYTIVDLDLGDVRLTVFPRTPEQARALADMLKRVGDDLAALADRHVLAIKD